MFVKCPRVNVTAVSWSFPRVWKDYNISNKHNNTTIIVKAWDKESAIEIYPQFNLLIADKAWNS